MSCGCSWTASSWRLVRRGLGLGSVVRLGRRLLGLHLGPGPLACLGPLRAGGRLLGREGFQLAVQDLGLAQPLVLGSGPVRLSFVGLGPLAGGAVSLLALSGLGGLRGLSFGRLGGLADLHLGQVDDGQHQLDAGLVHRLELNLRELSQLGVLDLDLELLEDRLGLVVGLPGLGLGTRRTGLPDFTGSSGTPGTPTSPASTSRMTTWPASNRVNPHSPARSATDRVASILQSRAHSFGPRATSSDGEAAARVGTAAGPPVAARMVSQVVARCRSSSNSAATGVGGATSWRVFLFLRNFHAATGQPSRSASASLRCSTTNSSTTESST